MRLTKREIQKLKTSLKKANAAYEEFTGAAGNLCSLITQITGVDGYVDHLTGDGFGFTPISNNDVHIPIEKLIELAEKGTEITEDEILDHLSI